MGASALTACLYFDRAHLEINRHSFRACGITICLYYPRITNGRCEYPSCMNPRRGPLLNVVAPFYRLRPGRFTLPRIKISAREPPRVKSFSNVFTVRAHGVLSVHCSSHMKPRVHASGTTVCDLACMIRRVRARTLDGTFSIILASEDVPRGNWRTCAEKARY